MSSSPPPLSRCLAAEVLGTFLLVFFGLGSVHVAVLTGDLTGLWQVGVVWGVAIMVAAYTVGGVSGAHINPAITIALASWGRLARERVLPYVIAQVTGAFLAAATVFTLFEPHLAAKEQAKGVKRGELGSVLTAMCYGEYFPNPGALAGGSDAFDAAAFEARQRLVSAWQAFLAEFVGTAILALIVAATTDSRNRMHPDRLAPLFIGLTVAILICVLAPLTQACFNPARDFGPRLFAFLAGWGPVAIPGPNGSGMLTVYILAPIAGALCGAGLYQKVFQPQANGAGESALAGGTP